MSKTINNISEVAQPRSEGEKAFKGLHNPVKAEKLVPGVTDQEHVFKGSTKPYDNKFNTGYKPPEDQTSYDKGVKVDDKETGNGYEKPTVGEATLSAKAARAGKDIGAPGKNFAKIAKDAAKRYGSKEAGEKVAGAVLAKMRANEDVETVDEAGSNNWDKVHRDDRNAREGSKVTKASMKGMRTPGEPTKAERRAELSSMPGYKQALAKKGLKEEELEEKHLTPAEMKKREEVAKAIARKSPDMPMAKKMAIATATAKKVTEDVDYDYEGEMAKTELRAICDKADKLADMMSDDMNLEAWLQSKISRAKDQIDSVYDYMMYKDKEPEAVSMVASPMATTYGSFLNRMGEETEMDEATDNKSLAALAPPKDKVTQKDILVGRGVLKKHPSNPDKHVLAKEEVDEIELKSPALIRAFENLSKLGK